LEIGETESDLVYELEFLFGRGLSIGFGDDERVR